MALITQAASLIIVPLDDMKAELRIPLDIHEHDTLISKQIQSAVSFVARSTGAEGDDLLPLRSAAIAVARDLYDGQHEITPNAAAYGWMEPFKSHKAE